MALTQQKRPVEGVLGNLHFLFLEVNLSMFQWHIDVFSFGLFGEAVGDHWIILLFIVSRSLYFCQTVRWICYEHYFVLNKSNMASSDFNENMMPKCDFGRWILRPGCMIFDGNPCRSFSNFAFRKSCFLLQFPANIHYFALWIHHIIHTNLMCCSTSNVLFTFSLSCKSIIFSCSFKHLTKCKS